MNGINIDKSRKYVLRTQIYSKPIYLLNWMSKIEAGKEHIKYQLFRLGSERLDCPGCQHFWNDT